jgi:hypothetical protein
LGDKIENEMGGTCSADGERRGAYTVLVEKREGKRPLGNPRRRWKVNIKIIVTVEPATLIVTVEEN